MTMIATFVVMTIMAFAFMVMMMAYEIQIHRQFAGQPIFHHCTDWSGHATDNQYARLLQGVDGPWRWPRRAVAKCIRYADNPIRLAHEMETDPSFQSLPSAVYGVVKIATGMDWLKPKKKAS